MKMSHLFPLLPLSFLLLLQYTFQVIEEEEDDDEDFNYEDEEGYLKVAIVEDKAYWISNNILYETEVIDEEIIKEDARPVDAFHMDFKEVNKMMTILDSIQDWKN
jgi:hypothetical protein